MCINNSQIPEKVLSNIVRIIEARSGEIAKEKNQIYLDLLRCYAWNFCDIS